jgi:hypothetical protein
MVDLQAVREGMQRVPTPRHPLSQATFAPWDSRFRIGYPLNHIRLMKRVDRDDFVLPLFHWFSISSRHGRSSSRTKLKGKRLAAFTMQRSGFDPRYCAIKSA